MATPAIRAFATGASEGTGSTVTKPTGTVSGDLLVAIVASDETTGVWVTLPSGFAEIANGGRSSESTTQPKYQVATKFAGGSEGANYAFGVPSFMSSAVWLYAITGVTSLISYSTIARGTVAACIAPSITYATHGGTDPLVLTAHTAVTEYTARTFTTPTSMSTAGGALNAAWMYAAGFSIGLTGNTDSGARSSTISAAEPWTACSVVIAQAAAVTPTKRLFLPF